MSSPRTSRAPSPKPLSTGRYSGVTVVLQWCYSGVTAVLQWCYSDVTVVLQWCYSDVTVVLQWCYSRAPSPKPSSAGRYSGITVVLQ
jgi:putative lipoic acid-binding regulatory protein